MRSLVRTAWRQPGLALFGVTLAVSAPTAPPNTAATTTPRPLRLVLVLDRSGSVGETIMPAKRAATAFVGRFQEGNDRLGLVVFGASAIVAFPPRDPAEPAKGTGPAPNFKSAKPNVTELIEAIEAGSLSGLAEALTLAHYELRKNPPSDTLNVIVLITDGTPNGITAEFNDPDPAKNLLRPASRCVHKPPRPDVFSMRGVIGQMGGFRPDGVVFGLMQMVSTSGAPAHSDVMAWLRERRAEPLLPLPASEGCAYRMEGRRVAQDVKAIPVVDLYGNPTDGDGYTESRLYDWHRIPLNLSAAGSAYQIGLASWNAADAAARRLREDRSLDAVIHTIGLVTGDPPDARLHRRISNVKDERNKSYSAWQPSGLTFISFSEEQLRAALGNVYEAIRKAQSSRR